MMAASSLLQCPDCSRLLHFTSDKTTITTCASCGTVVWRHTDRTIVAKPQYPILEKNDIIQPGTTGIWEEKKFIVLGRFRAWFEEAVFNYWTICFEDEEIAWLTEGYGIYSIMRPIPLIENISSQSLYSLNTGSSKELIPGKRFVLRKKQNTVKWEIEGELFAPGNESALRVLDFGATDGLHISLFEWGRHNIFSYQEFPASFASLHLNQLREHTYSEKNFACRKCSQTIHVKTFPYAQSCACKDCGLSYELKDGLDFRKDEMKKVLHTIYLPLGSTGTIDGIRYEVIGYARKQEQNSYHSEWTEFTLFNPQEGFAFLSEYEGNWIYIRERIDSPVLLNQNVNEFDYNKELFHLFNSYTHKVISASGEFPYNIFDNNKTKAREFISPPEMWIEERNGEEGINWYFGKHINHRTVKNAFDLSLMPAKRGIGAVQPSGFINRTNITMTALIGIFFLICVHLLINKTKEERVLINTAYPFSDSSNTVSVVTEKFQLDKWRSNLCFSIEALVYNTWFELNATLVNAETGKEYALEQGVEYYAGYSEGESWTEGSQREVAYLTGIPAGTYFLQLQGSREASFFGSRSITDFYLKVVYDVPVTRNLGWAIFLLLLWPAGKWMISSQREKNRWSNSPFST